MCRFKDTVDNLSFERIKLMLIYVVFEVEVIVVIMLQGVRLIVLLILVTVGELIVMYI